MYIISFHESNLIQLINKFENFFTQVYYASHFVNYTVYECVKHKKYNIVSQILEFNRNKGTL